MNTTCVRLDQERGQRSFGSRDTTQLSSLDRGALRAMRISSSSGGPGYLMPNIVEPSHCIEIIQGSAPSFTGEKL